MTTRSYAVRVAESAADRAACLTVRHEVFVREQGVPVNLEYDAHDKVAVHVLAIGDDGAALGTARLLHGAAAAERTGVDPAVGSLGRVAVTSAARGLGVGAALVRGIEETAASLGLAEVDLHAQTRALAFYERLGYAAYGGEFLDAGIVHRAMRRKL
ncbi:GNAT family N-acetyltransferase [Streptomyces luteolus]|uniref:GNAT family N-acetyltransferase n=1 Tax=Streptomyces luteolus TaxID=3043615 RepID=A0ABT6T6A8_9ACTN|nr:GNAT family N-acetyltransferase [Streptomyces sp. B-S-A12]MDI3422427.1 GNAT family N-acetyltransferase [Streptomyces sp. B-S-A12]